MQVDFHAVCKGIAKVVSTIMHDAPYVTAGSSANLLEWAEAANKTKDKLAEVVHRVTVTASGDYQDVACKAYDVVFANDGQVRRFPSLQEQVKTSNVPNRVQDALITARSVIGVMVTTAEQHLYDSSLPEEKLQQLFQQLKHSMGRCMVAHMVRSLKRSLTLPPDFQLIEDSVTAGDRRKLQQRIASLQGAIRELEELKSAPAAEGPHDQAHYVPQADANDAAAAAVQQALGNHNMDMA